MAFRKWVAASAVAMLLASGAPAAWAETKAPAIVAAAPESVGFSAEGLKKLDAHMQGLVDKGHLPGVTTMLMRHGKVVNFQVHGKKGFDGPPMTKDTVFRIYSQTKPVTGVAMMILFEEGKWTLDDPVSKFIPEFANLRVLKGVNADGSFDTVPAERPPTMRELMSHSAGFAYGLTPDNPLDKAYADKVLGARSRADFVKAIAEIPLVDQPGKRWKYSIAVDIQGLIVEKLTGLSLGDFMKSRIFDPLKMKDTGFWLPAEKADRLASLYVWSPKVNKLVPADGYMVLDITKPPAMASGGGGLVSTNADYARFAQMLLNGGELEGARILKPETVTLMRTNALSDAIMTSSEPPFNTARGRGFGLDFAIVLDSAKAGPQGEGTYSWGGAAGTWFWIDPKNDLFFLGMIHILNKAGDPAIKDIDDDSAKLVYDALIDPKK
ncbi:class A beta-lactamase-related serine hydrolase [Caulobacter vibrioides]|uniref:serine hydrolase domain-containing protein n=1 Tax=Caulobacter vibrioides TaxID=155892 RepID=UPI000BB515F6|nr:serine hydrolase domain-containing protein [Caulobacter vibrioides]ATC24580.1 serine hydrolase [Caulobacter vibrioides]AZH12720.1 class A beta-lactamase-related serine hydrolase [Caulobacter vibrioides]PLR10175.1 serine hydrolase [Caulobacter vibrioides]